MTPLLRWALASFPFVIFVVPVIGETLHQSKATGYDQAGKPSPSLLTLTLTPTFTLHPSPSPLPSPSPCHPPDTIRRAS